jgi:hypothetical protein
MTPRNISPMSLTGNNQGCLRDKQQKGQIMAIPPFLYHGSSTADIDTLEPRKRYTPGNEKGSPEGIYATDDPAFAAAHAFPWASTEGINLYYDEDIEREGRTCVHLEVPASLYERLNQPVCIYKLDSHSFSWVQQEVVGRTYRSLESIKCLSCHRFSTVIEAIETFGGKVFKI